MICKIGNSVLAVCIFVGLLSLSVQLFSTYQTSKKYEVRQEMLTKIDVKKNDIALGVAKVNALQSTINCLLYQNQKLQERNSTIAVGTTTHSSTMPDCNKYMKTV